MSINHAEDTGLDICPHCNSILVLRHGGFYCRSCGQYAYTLVKNGTDEQVTVMASDLFQAREIASLQYAIPVWQLAWKREPIAWTAPACETDFVPASDEVYF